MRCGTRCRFGWRWSVDMWMGGGFELGCGVTDRLTPSLGHPPCPLRPEGKSPSGERGTFAGATPRSRGLVLGCISPSLSPQPPSLSQFWEREGGSGAQLRKPPSFSWNREKEGGWGMDEGEASPSMLSPVRIHRVLHDRHRAGARSQDIGPRTSTLNASLSPEGEGLRVRRSRRQPVSRIATNPPITQRSV
jgi:hypothetical protein